MFLILSINFAFAMVLKPLSHLYVFLTTLYFKTISTLVLNCVLLGTLFTLDIDKIRYEYDPANNTKASITVTNDGKCIPITDSVEDPSKILT